MSLQQAQEQLQNALVTTYLANLAFLSEYDNPLFQRVERLSQAIQNGAYKENFSLEFLEKDGDFDVYDHKRKTYLYNKKPSKYNRHAVQNVDFTSKGSFTLFEPQLFQGKYYTSVFEEVEYFCNFDYSHKCLVNDLFSYVKVLKNNISDYKFKKFVYIDKFMFIGTKLGRHIPLILEKIKAKNFFVCEPNLEIFRLSLFTVDYSNLARDGKTVLFSIMDDASSMESKLEVFFMNKLNQNYMIKYFTTDYNIEDYFNHILTSSLAYKNTSFNYYMMLENIWKNVTQRINHYPVLQLQSQKQLDFTNIPVLFLAAGPSLHENLKWIKNNQNKFIVVSIGAVNKILVKKGINPDIIATVDPQFNILNKKQFDDETVKYLQNSLLFASINTDQRILNKFKKKNIFLYEMNKPLYSNNICHKGFSIGEIAASILVSLKFKNIYLLGLDLALNQETGDTHTQQYSSKNYSSNFKNQKFSENNASFTFDEELIEVKGNFSDAVYTNRLFALSLNALNSNFALFKQKNQTIYNLSSNGAFIEKTQSKKIENIKCELFETLNKNELKHNLEEFLHAMSNSRLSKTNMQTIYNEINYLYDLQKTLNDFQLNPSKDFEEFDNRCQKIMNDFLFPKIYCSFLFVVFMPFFGIILQYIYYCFNMPKIKDEKNKIKEVETIFLKQLCSLLNKYISYIKQI